MAKEYQANSFLTDNGEDLVISKADIDSPTLTGAPKAPTAALGSYNKIIATTEFVVDAMADLVADVAILSNGIDAFAHAKRVSEAGGTTIDIIPLDEVIRASRGSASLLITPNSIATSKVFSQLPDSSAGDFPFVRASTATQINKYGISETVASGVPRRDYTNGVPALLIEQQRTNWCLNSEVKSVLTYNNEVILDDDITIPNRSNVLRTVKVTPNTTVSHFHRVGGSTTFTKTFPVNTIITLSVSILPKDFFYFSVGGFFSQESAFFELIGNGRVVSSASNVLSASIKLDSNGFYRISTTYNFQNTVGNNYLYTGVWVYDSIAKTPWGSDGIKSFNVTEFQIEDASYPTSYIPTSGTAVTRVADTMSKTGISDLIGQSEGSMLVEAEACSNGGSYRMISISDGTNNNMINIEWHLSSNTIFGAFIVAGVSYFQANNSLPQTQNNKLMVTWQNGMFKFFTNGVKIFEKNTFPNITTQLFNTLKFSRPDNLRYFEGNVKQLHLYKTALTDQECINLTTL